MKRAKNINRPLVSLTVPIIKCSVSWLFQLNQVVCCVVVSSDMNPNYVLSIRLVSAFSVKLANVVLCILVTK